MNQQTEGKLRHVLTLIAGFIGALNLLPEETIGQGQLILADVIGIIFAAIAFYRSHITKLPEG